MVGRLILALLVASVSSAAVAQPNFTASHGEVVPAAPYAGDVVRHVFTITNTGTSASLAIISSSLRRGFLISKEGDCAGAAFDDSGDIAWYSGRFDAGATVHCTLTVLTRSSAAGTLANVVTEIRTPPSGYFRVEAAAELRTVPDPNAVRVGPVLMTRAGMVVMVLLALLIVGTPIVMALSRSQAGARLAAGVRSSPTGIHVGGWVAVVIATGFLLFFVGLAYEDWRAYTDYRETRCTVFGSEVQAFEHRSRAREAERSYAPLFALRYLVDGVETFSTGYTTSSALNFNTRAGTGSVFEHFAVGATHPCWYDPQRPQTVLLTRGPGGAYFFALLPLPVLAIGLSVLMGMRRRHHVASGVSHL